MSNALAPRRFAAAASVLLLSALGTVAFAGPAAAAPLAASTEAELVAAINTANLDAAADVITLSGTGFALTAGLPAITSDLSIVGPGSAAFTLTGAGSFSAFSANNLADTVAISGLTVTATSGGAIAAYGTNLALSDVVVESEGLYFEDGNLSIADSEFTGSDEYGAVVWVYSSQTAVIENSSFDSNAWAGVNLSAYDDTVVTLTDVSAESNGEAGFNFNMYDQASLTATRTTATANFYAGLDLGAYDDAVITLTDVSADSNVGTGFHFNLNGQASLTAAGTTATASTDDSGLNLDLEDASTATLTDTIASGNDGDGIVAWAYNDSSVVLETVSTEDNGSDGMDLYADGGASIGFTDATATFNGDNGVEADSYGTGSTVSFLRLDSTDNEGSGIDARAEEDGYLGFTEAELRRNFDGGFYLNGDGSPGVVDLTDSTIDDNGGGVMFESSAGIALTITGSTISNNVAETGGGIYAELDTASSLTIVNSSISGNTAEYIGGLYAYAVNSDAQFSITHSTIADNESTVEYPAVVIEDLTAAVQHTIIAGNTGGGADPDDLVLYGGDVEIDYSLIQDVDPAGETTMAAGTGNILGIGADLGPLADNGGLTLTHLPSASSRAVNAGDPAITGAPATDQRGAARIVRVIDLGAVEVQAPVALAATGNDPAAPLLVGGILGATGILLLAVAARNRRHAVPPAEPIY